jgi:hypothetical protein
LFLPVAFMERSFVRVGAGNLTPDYLNMPEVGCAQDKRGFGGGILEDEVLG